MSDHSPANSPKTGRRVPATAFKPGQSGNPRGRPRVVEEFRARARRAVDDRVLDAWISEVEQRGLAWVRCSELLASYGYGRPAPLGVDLAEAGAENPFSVLTVDELRALARGVVIGGTDDSAGSRRSLGEVNDRLNVGAHVGPSIGATGEDTCSNVAQGR